MWITLDLILAVVIISYIFICARHGFIRNAIEVVGFAFAIYLSFALSGIIADTVYRNTIEQRIVKKVTASVNDSSKNTVNETVHSVFEYVPKMVKDSAENIGLNEKSVSDNITKKLGNTASVEQMAASATKSIAEPVLVPIIKSIAGLILFAVCMFLVRALAKVVDRAAKLPVIDRVNSFLGGILGLIKGMIIACAICIIISTIVAFTENGFLIFTKENIDRSYLFGLFSKINPLY